MVQCAFALEVAKYTNPDGQNATTYLRLDELLRKKY